MKVAGSSVGSPCPEERKVTDMENTICYCFGYTEEDIARDVEDNKGRSMIMERIASEKKSGGCNCGKNHPLGR